jgi:hypothetical protein
VKTPLHVCVLAGLIAVAGCESPHSESLDVAARRQAEPIRIEFIRTARLYEDGDAVLSMANDTRQVLWFIGQGPELPIYRLKTGTGVTPEQSTATAGRSAAERFPLSPGESHYFEIKTGNAAGPISIGVTFYSSFSSANGTTVWSPPVTVPLKTGVK